MCPNPLMRRYRRDIFSSLPEGEVKQSSVLDNPLWSLSGSSCVILIEWTALRPIPQYRRIQTSALLDPFFHLARSRFSSPLDNNDNKERLNHITKRIRIMINSLVTGVQRTIIAGECMSPPTRGEPGSHPPPYGCQRRAKSLSCVRIELSWLFHEIAS
jgi:hypothetical protein